MRHIVATCLGPSSAAPHAWRAPSSSRDRSRVGNVAAASTAEPVKKAPRANVRSATGPAKHRKERAAHREGRREAYGTRSRHRHDRMAPWHPWGAVGHGEIPRDRVVQRLQVALVRAPGEQGLTAGGLEGEGLAERHGQLEESSLRAGEFVDRRDSVNASSSSQDSYGRRMMVIRLVEMLFLEPRQHSLRREAMCCAW